MEKRSFSKWIGGVEDEIEEVSIQVKQESPTSVWLRSLFPDIVIVEGSISGKRYTFQRSGVELEVDARDAPKMLEKRFGGNSCCGSNAKPQPYFVVV